jgi:alpha-L-fucosidase
MPEKKDKSFMAGYDINELIKPKKELAHIEYFFTRKKNDLYCIVPAYSPQIVIRNFKPTSSATALLLSNKKIIKWKQVGNDLMLDLTGIKPGELAGEMFVIKIKNAL